MTAPLVIKHLDVIEQLHLRLAKAVEAIGGLTLDRRKEGFHHSVVVAIAATTHRARDAKAQAVRLVLDEGQSVGAVARDLDLTETALGVSPSGYYPWSNRPESAYAQ